MEFPQFRRYTNGKSYFRIDNHSRMTEVQVLGKYWMLHEIEAKILPERNLIRDLVENTHGACEVLDQAEYEAFLNYCKTELTQREF